jgi:hypothetical protein
MASIVLQSFLNPLEAPYPEIAGLSSASYPLTLDSGNSYTYNYGSFPNEYRLVGDPFANSLQIQPVSTPGPPITIYILSGTDYIVLVDSLSRPDVEATYFTTGSPPVPPPPTPIYIRPAVTTDTIRYNWEVSTITADNYILTCASTDGGSGGGTVSLSSNDNVYIYTGLTFGKTYECGINGSNTGIVGNSTFFRTVTTGDLPGAPESISFISTPTTLTLSWSAPTGAQTPPVGWYVITDSNNGAQYNTRFFTTSITIPFDGTAHTYRLQSVSDTGYSTYADLIVA